MITLHKIVALIFGSFFLFVCCFFLFCSSAFASSIWYQNRQPGMSRMGATFLLIRLFLHCPGRQSATTHHRSYTLRPSSTDSPDCHGRSRRAGLPAIVLLAASLVRVVLAAEDGLVAHYPFDEGTGFVVRDAGPHGLDGIIHGATYQALEQGFALEFDGVDDHVKIPNTCGWQLRSRCQRGLTRQLNRGRMCWPRTVAVRFARITGSAYRGRQPLSPWSIVRSTAGR